MDNLEYKLKQQVIEVLNLEDVSPEDIDNSEPLFEEGLGLDSIDALELIVLLEREYQLKMEDASLGKKVFENINSMAEYIRANKA